jgi:hypothetical protein
MLRTAFGPAIALWLEDASVVEVMLNPDGRRAVSGRFKKSLISFGKGWLATQWDSNRSPSEFPANRGILQGILEFWGSEAGPVRPETDNPHTQRSHSRPNLHVWSHLITQSQ